MARLDYSRFNGLGDSDSEEESTPAAQARPLGKHRGMATNMGI